jgi:ketosteroid isomerase-like protein
MNEVLTERVKKAFDFAAETTKQLITLSTGIIALTITFTKDLLKSVSPFSKWLLIASWCIYLLSIMAGLATLMALTASLEPKPEDVASPPSSPITSPPEETPPSVRDQSVVGASMVQIFAFLVATFLIVAGSIVTTYNSLSNQSGTASPDVKKLQSEMFDALMRRDIPALESMCANDYVLTNGFAEPFNKAQLLTALQSGDLALGAITVGDSRTAAYADVVLHGGTLNLQGRYKNTDVSGRYRFSNVFAKKEEQWLAVASQWVRVQEPPPQSKDDKEPKSPVEQPPPPKTSTVASPSPPATP